MKVAFNPNRAELASVTWGRSPPAPLLLGINRQTLIEKTGRTNDPAEVKVWDITDAPNAVEVPSWGTITSALAFQPDGKQFAVGYTRGPTGEVAVWNTQTGKQVRLPMTDGEGAAYHRRDGKSLWDSKAGKRVGVIANDMSITAVVYSPDGKRLAIGEGMVSEPGKPGSVRIWNTEMGGWVGRIPIECGGVFGLAFHPKGDEIAIACWDVSRPMEASSDESKLGLVNLYPFLTPAGARGQVRRWRISGNVEVERIPESGPVTALAWANSSNCFSWATWRLNVISNEEVNVKGILKAQGWPDLPVKTVGEHNGIILGLAISSDGSQIATAGVDGVAKVWSHRSGEGPLMLLGHTDAVNAIAFSPDGRRIATSSEDKTIKVWDAESGYELMTLKGHVNAATCVAFSPDGHTLASGRGADT